MPAPLRDTPLSTDEVIRLFARTAGEEKSREAVEGAAAVLGLPAGELGAPQLRRLLDALSRVRGAVGVAAQLARTQVGLSPPAALAGMGLPAPTAHDARARGASSESSASRGASFDSSASRGASSDSSASRTRATMPPPTPIPPSPRPPSDRPTGERLPRKVLVELLAHSLGAERGDGVVAAAARRLRLDPTAFSREEALLILEDLMKMPGVVGTTARFARPRCVLRFRA